MNLFLTQISSLSYLKTFCAQSTHVRSLSKHNQTHFYISIFAAVLYLVTTVSLCSFSEFDASNFALHALNLIISIAAIKSTGRGLYLIYIVYISFTTMLIATSCKQSIFSHIGFAIILPQLMLTGSSNISLYAVLVLTQIIAFQYRLRSQLTEMFKVNDSDLLFQNFINSAMILYLFLMISYGVAIHILTVCTSELEQHIKNHTEASEKHKLNLLRFSHELRNPINGLLGNLNLSLLEEISGEARKMLQSAKVCGDVLLQQVNDMLDNGKLESGNLEIECVPTRVHELSQRSWAIFSGLIRRKGLFGSLRVAKNMPALLSVDPYRINQIMLNLIGNAVKFTERGSINISLNWLEESSVSNRSFEPIPYSEEDEGIFEKDEKVARLNPNDSSYLLTHDRKAFSLEEAEFPSKEVNGVLKIVVTDTGAGMTDEERKKLFGKFCQVSSNIQSRQIGTGLGLYITNEICKKMGGVVKAYSRKDVGATFIACIPSYSLPVQQRVQNNGLLSMEALQGKGVQVIAAGKSVNFLSRYVEMVRGTLTASVSDGYAAYLAYSKAKEGGKKIDVVILEAGMPKMDEKLCVQKIRKYEQENGLKPVNVIIICDTESFKHADFGQANMKENPIMEMTRPIYFEQFCSTLNTLITTGEGLTENHENPRSLNDSFNATRLWTV